MCGFTKEVGGVIRSIFLGEINASWLLATLEALAQAVGVEDFVKSSKVRSRDFITQRGSNYQGRYLSVAKYGGGGRKDFIVIPEERDGKGWRTLASELSKIIDFFPLGLRRLVHC